MGGTLDENRYRFSVDLTAKKLTGELFVSWDELFLVGGAASCGWNSYVMLPFTRDKKELCVWTWTGELKNRTENTEPRRFKITGQNAWDPKVLHPFTQDENPLSTTQFCSGGDDNKWQIQDDGIYRITVDVFHETFRTEYLGSSYKDGGITRIESSHADDSVQIAVNGNRVSIDSPEEVGVSLYTAQGILVAKGHGSKVALDMPLRNLYLLQVKGRYVSLCRTVSNY